jgi:hypothetical protein
MDNKTISGNIKKNIPYHEIPSSPFFDPSMNYYICSYGGSGSTMLYNYLANFGRTYHIHSRYPPEKLTYTGSIFSTKEFPNEWFNEVEITEENIKYYKVIYIYRNPVYAIYSSFINTEFKGYIGACMEHLRNIQCTNNGNIHLSDIVKHRKDLYNIEGFFYNYVNKKQKNYSIICVKYEDFFNYIQEFNKIINIPDCKELYPLKRESKRPTYYYQILNEIYGNLIDDMNKMKPIEIR